MTRRLVKKREALAIMPEALHTDRKAIWWDLPTPIPPNERRGNVAIVSIRGSLDHHYGYGCDSYEAIIDRVTAAFDGEDDGAPKYVMLRFDSPGGVVSGLNETVFKLRRMAEEKGIPLIAYVDELAASAAYALSCACSEIYLPESAIAGSVGVISTMFDQVEADKEMGINFVTLTSGARKADGHPHVAISEAAINAEQHRIDKLAKQFFAIVSKARGLSTKEVASYEAGIFLGVEAVNVGLADETIGFEELLSTLNSENSVDALRQNAPTSKTSNGAVRAGKAKTMSLAALKALVRRTEAALTEAKDPKKVRVLAKSLSAYEAALEAYKKEKHTIEKHESEEGEEDDEESEEESEESEEEEAKGNETDRKEKKSAKADDSDDDSDDDDKDEDDDEDSEEEAAASGSVSRALATLAQKTTGKNGRAAVGALAAMIEQGRRASQRIDQIEKERRVEKKGAMIDEALSARAVSRAEVAWLKTQPLATIRSFVDSRRGKNGKLRAIVNTDDESLAVPSSGASEGVSASVLAEVDRAVQAAPDGVDRTALRKTMIEAHEKRMAAALNGAGRY